MSNLERHVASEPGVGGAADLTHAAGAERSDDADGEMDWFDADELRWRGASSSFATIAQAIDPRLIVRVRELQRP